MYTYTFLKEIIQKGVQMMLKSHLRAHFTDLNRLYMRCRGIYSSILSVLYNSLELIFQTAAKLKGYGRIWCLKQKNLPISYRRLCCYLC